MGICPFGCPGTCCILIILGNESLKGDSVRGVWMITLMSGYNEAKIEILGVLEELGEATAPDLASILGRSHESVGMALLRYHRHGLVSRYTIERRTKVYELTERGLERLEYLRSL